VAESIYGAGTAPLAIAHRGGAGLAAENTLVAFGRSYALGVRYLETDVRVTADGACVAFHDAALRRVTGRRGMVRGATRRELAGFGVPTLDEVLVAYPDACFTVDVKEGAAVAPLVRTLLATKAAHRVCVAGAWDGWLAGVRHEVGPALTTALGWRALSTFVAGIPGGTFGGDASAGRHDMITCGFRTSDGARSAGDQGSRAAPPGGGATRTAASGRFAHVPSRVVQVFGARLVARAHALGVRIIVWTVNDPAQMHRLLDLGMDGIITDRPDLLREVLVARDQWVAPSPTAPSPTTSERPS
jgi:glycerophosphoryl diester phosphodiesterase